MGDDEEVPDVKAIADTKCKESFACKKMLVEYEECAARIEKKGRGECSGYYHDYIGCVDRCASGNFFPKLK